MKYGRVVLKLSGETLSPLDDRRGIDMDSAARISSEVKSAYSSGAQMSIVIGGGNLFRGADVASGGGISQAQADRIGMLATIMNGIALQEAMSAIGMDTALMSSIGVSGVAKPFDRRLAIRHLDKGSVLIFCAGTGNPFFSTDTAAALRALDIGADAVLKGTKVDGVYSDDPNKNSNAKKFDELSYMEVIEKKLRVMDLTAISMCMDHKLPIVVFDVFEKGNLKKVIDGKRIGTVVYG